jgi:hypothetical protein
MVEILTNGHVIVNGTEFIATLLRVIAFFRESKEAALMSELIWPKLLHNPSALHSSNRSTVQSLTHRQRGPSADRETSSSTLSCAERQGNLPLGEVPCLWDGVPCLCPEKSRVRDSWACPEKPCSGLRDRGVPKNKGKRIKGGTQLPWADFSTYRLGSITKRPIREGR